MSSEIRAEKKKKKSPETPSLITSLPDDIIYDIIARVPRCNYKNLSLVSKQFKSLIASPELYARRSFLGHTKPFIYLCTRDDTGDYSLYILRPKANINGFVLIWSLPPMSSIVALGSKIYVFGGISDDFKVTTKVFSINCRNHTVQSLPNMPMRMAVKVTDIIGGKIYVIGHIDEDSKKKVMAVFNTKTQMWEPEMTKMDIELGYIWHGVCVVHEDKMYVRDSKNSFVYEPKENKWETDAMMNSEKWNNACMVDDILYYYDYLKNELRAYDRKQRLWRAVKGVGTLLPYLASCLSLVMNYSGKLVVFLHCLPVIWYAEISLERREGEEIWGKVEWSDNVVLKSCLSLMKSLVVMV